MSFQRAVLERVEPATPRITRFFFRSALPAHVAGQHVDVRLTAEDGYVAQRSYSIASRPGDALLELAIERLDDGEVSAFFHEVARPGDVFELRGPLGGHFVWRARDAGPLLLVAGGSGIAPLIAIARERAASAPTLRALMVYSARRWEDLAYRDELLSQASEHFRVVFVTTREPKRRAVDHERRLDAALLDELLRGWGTAPTRSYVCGSTPFVEAVTQALLDQRLPPSSLRAERYGGA